MLAGFHVEVRPGMRAGKLQDANGTIFRGGKNRRRRAAVERVQKPTAYGTNRGAGRRGGWSSHADSLVGWLGSGECEHAGALHLFPRNEPRGFDRDPREPWMCEASQRRHGRTVRSGGRGDDGGDCLIDQFLANRFLTSASNFRPRSGLPRACRAANRASNCRSAKNCVTKLSNKRCTLVPDAFAAPNSALCRESSQR